MTAEQKSAEEANKAEDTSAEDFIAKSPLFVPIRVNGFEPPDTISFDCRTAGCGKGTTWKRFHDPSPLGINLPGRREIVDSRLKSVAYQCYKCKKSALSVVYLDWSFENRPVEESDKGPVTAPGSGIPFVRRTLVRVMKVGQYPEPAIAIPDALEKNLGEESAALYRKSLICRNNGFGLAAAAYIRRVVEDKTNELIEVVAKYSEALGVDAKKVETFRSAANSSDTYTPYDEKLKIASAVFPESLKVCGKNPLLSLFRLVSEGIHGKSEAECIKIAENTDEVFQYLFTNLKAETEIRKSFIEKMKELP